MSPNVTRFQWERQIISARGPANPTTRHVLLTVATHINKQQGTAWPSIRMLMAETLLSNRCVIEHLHCAETDGWIKRSSVLGEGKAWRRSVYTPVVPDFKPIAGDRASPPYAPEGSDPGAQGGDHRAEGGDPDDIKVVTVRHTNIEVLTDMNNLKNIVRAQDSSSAPQQPAKSKPFFEEKKNEHGKAAQDLTSAQEQPTANPSIEKETEQSQGGLSYREKWFRDRGLPYKP